MPEQPKSSKYFAFISYSRKDSKAAAWLQKRLEWFRFPVKLVPIERRPPDPKYLRRIFRDKTDLKVTNEHYWKNIRLALDESRFLIVLCSPNSAMSEPVNMEVKHFLDKHGNNTNLIAPVLLGGDVTSEGESAALCPTLRDLRDPNGDPLIRHNLSSMVPDTGATEQEGWEQGFVSLVSYLLSLDRSAVGDHIHYETKRQVMVRRRTLAAIIVSAVVAVVAIVFAQIQQREAARQRDLACLSAATDMLKHRRLVRAQERLDQIPEANRKWEWRYLQRRIDKRDRVLNFKEVPVQAAFGLIISSIHRQAQREVFIKEGKATFKLLPWLPDRQLEDRGFPVTLPPAKKDASFEEDTIELHLGLMLAVVSFKDHCWVFPILDDWMAALGTDQRRAFESEESKQMLDVARNVKPFRIEGKAQEVHFLNGIELIIGNELWEPDKTGVWRRKAVCDKPVHRLRSSLKGRHLHAVHEGAIYQLDPQTLAATLIHDNASYQSKLPAFEHSSLNPERWGDYFVTEDGSLLTRLGGFNHRLDVAHNEISGWNMLQIDGQEVTHDELINNAVLDLTSLLDVTTVRYQSVPSSLEDIVSEEADEQNEAHHSVEETKEQLTVSAVEWRGGHGLLFSSDSAHRLEGHGDSRCISLLNLEDHIITLHEDATVGEWLPAYHAPEGGCANAEESELEETESPSRTVDDDHTAFFLPEGSMEKTRLGRIGAVIPLAGSRFLFMHAASDFAADWGWDHHLCDYTLDQQRWSSKDLYDERLEKTFPELNLLRLGPHFTSVRQGRSTFSLMSGSFWEDERGTKSRDNYIVIEWGPNGDPIATYGAKAEIKPGFEPTWHPDPATKFTVSQKEMESEDVETEEDFLTPHDVTVTLPDGTYLLFSNVEGFAIPLETHSPDGSRIACIESGELYIRDAADRSILLEVTLGQGLWNPRSISWSGDGHLLAILFGGKNLDHLGYMVLDGRPHQGTMTVGSSFLPEWNRKLEEKRAEAAKEQKDQAESRDADKILSIYQNSVAMEYQFTPDDLRSVETLVRRICSGVLIQQAGPFKGKIFKAKLSESQISAVIPLLRLNADGVLMRWDQTHSEPLPGTIGKIESTAPIKLKSPPAESVDEIIRTLPPPPSVTAKPVEILKAIPEDVFPAAKPTEKPGVVISPHSPFVELNVTGIPSGSLALDPTTQKVFRVP